MKGTDNDIKKYKAGELTPAERHALEKKALSDPFLADALEGAEQISAADFKNDVDAINKRIGRKKTVFTPMRIAAGVIIIITATWTSLYLTSELDYNELTEKRPEKTSGSGDSVSTVGPSPTKDQQEDKLLSLKKESEEKKEERKNERVRVPSTTQPTLAAQDKVVADDSATKPVETEETDIAEEQIAERRTELSDTLSRSLAQADQSTQGQGRTEQFDRARVTTGERLQLDTRSDEGKMSKAAPATAKEAFSIPANIITGKVTLADDNVALPGVNVTVKGTNIGAVTDINGNYTIETNGQQPTLVFSFIGLQTKEATAGSGPTLDVKLVEDVSQLSEVVVTGWAAPKDLSGEPVVRLAEPVGGRRAYNNYLESNLRYPQLALNNNIKGRVGIQFTVGTDGGLDEFTVTKSLGFGCDEEVIRLVKEGPAWIPSSENNVPVESVVRIRMRFDPSKRK